MLTTSETKEIRGRQVELNSYFLVRAVVFEELVIECRWLGAATANVYIDGKEVDCFTSYEMKTIEDLEQQFIEWLAYQFELEEE